jgi:hypothetical protein
MKHLDDITADEFLKAACNSAGNGVAKPHFRSLLEQLNALPAVRERLAFEFIPLTLKALNDGNVPLQFAIWLPAWTESVTESRRVDFINRIEEIILRGFELRCQGDTSTEMTIVTALIAIRKIDQTRFNASITELRSKCRSIINEDSGAIATEVEAMITKVNMAFAMS